MARYYHETRMAKTKSARYETVRVGARRRITIPSRIAKALQLKKSALRFSWGRCSEVAEIRFNAIILSPFAAAQGKLREGPRQFAGVGEQK